MRLASSIPLALLLPALAVPAAAQPARAPTAGANAPVHWLPTRYEAGRFFLVPVTTAGDTLVFYPDTGGGANMLWASTVERLSLPTERIATGDDSVQVTPFPEFTPSRSIPRAPMWPPMGERLLVLPEPEGRDDDGFLGRLWFADRVWVLDYPGRRMGLLQGPISDATPGARAPLGFQTDSLGARTTHFPRLRVEIDGDSLDLLFDTGATIHLTDAGRAALGPGAPAAIGGSFITESVFRRWRERHPEWRVVEGGDRTLDMPMIEVPRVSIAGLEVGPVWVSARPDQNFHSYMSQWMDRRVEGALGGSALQYLRVLVDYPRAIAVFQK